uniref:Uncharacterized protein n=1 Tax=Ditylenchus dipsaci TaxID=166011 RepID=A0A915DL32_9BILA
MIRLDRDLLYEIAEKMVVGQAAGSDGEPLSKLFEFMMASRGCKLAFLSQFSKVERFVLTSSPGSYFYVSSSSGKINYCGDFGKDKPFVAFLIQHEKFRPKHLTLSEVIGSVEKQSEDVVDLKKLSAMKCLCVLLGLYDCGLDLANYHWRDLLLEKLCVVDKACSLAHLDNILALNSKQLEVSIDGVSGLHCLPENRNYQSVNCSRTETLSLVYISDCCCRDDEFPVSEWIDLLRYILACCPISRSLMFHISFMKTAGLPPILYATVFC